MSGRINLLSPEIRANPYPVYAELRRHPVGQVDPGGLWAVSRQEDALHVFKNPHIFSSEAFRQAYRPPWIPNYPLADSMLVMDPPRHTKMRALVSRAFGPQVISRVEPQVRRFAARIVEELPEGEAVNFVERFSVLMPMRVLAELLGLSEEVQPRMLGWAQRFGGFTGIGPEDTARQEAVRAAVNEARAQFEQVLAERRRQPGDDLISDLIRARVDGEQLSDTDLLGFMFVLLVGGMETTIHLLSHSALQLHLQPEWLTALREQPALAAPFIEEVLRYEAPAHGVMRLTTQETQLGGVTLPKGARILMLMGAINRDAAQSPDPERFDPRRVQGQILPFGQGIHFCIGSQLARLEGRLALEALASRFSRLGAGSEPVQWNSSLIVRGPTRLSLVPHADQPLRASL